MKKKVRAAAYGRVSTEKDDQVNSLISQREYFSDYIRQHEDWELTGIYYDEGISGTQTANRRGFNQMIQDAMAGKIDLILTKEVSRFARNTVDTLSYIRKLKEKGVRVIFTIDNIDTMDGDGELRLSIMATLAQDESRKTSERVKWGQKRRMEQGVVFGRDLLGYTVKAGNLFVNEEEAGIDLPVHHVPGCMEQCTVPAQNNNALHPFRNGRRVCIVVIGISFTGFLCPDGAHFPLAFEISLRLFGNFQSLVFFTVGYDKKFFHSSICPALCAPRLPLCERPERHLLLVLLHLFSLSAIGTQCCLPVL